MKKSAKVESAKKVTGLKSEKKSDKKINMTIEKDKSKIKSKAKESKKQTQEILTDDSSVESLLPKKLKIGVVRSRFNEDITEKLEFGALDYLENLGVEVEIIVVQVPGAVEIPLACQALFRKACHGVVAVGAVIRGDTTHYDYVCNSVERGVSQLMLDWGRPIGFGVITTENEEQAYARAGGEHGNKGADAAQVVIEMIGLLNDLNSAE